MKFFIHALCIFAVLSATISPACAFISGKHGDWIEICSGAQNLKIKVPSDDIPDITTGGCEFCFQHFNMNAVEGDSVVLNVLLHGLPYNNFINEIALVHFHQSYQSRAPPAV